MVNWKIWFTGMVLAQQNGGGKLIADALCGSRGASGGVLAICRREWAKLNWVCLYAP